MIQRYEIYAATDYSGDIQIWEDVEKDKNGPWVKYEDHKSKVEQLEKELQEVREKLRISQGWEKNHSGVVQAFADVLPVRNKELEDLKDRYRWRKVEDELPDPNTLVWCRRKKGSIILSIRGKESISTNPDPSRNCFWHSVQMCDFDICNPCKSHWSDVTVQDWCYLEKPQAEGVGE